MIRACFLRDGDGAVRGLTIKNHGEGIVCAAVSALALNTVNSLSVLTSDAFDCKHSPDGGYIALKFASAPGFGAKVLLDSLVLGLSSTAQSYPGHITITDTKEENA